MKYKNKKSKDQAMYEAYLQYSYTLKDIAEYIGVHYTTMDRVIKKIEGEDEKWHCKTKFFSQKRSIFKNYVVYLIYNR